MIQQLSIGDERRKHTRTGCNLDINVPDTFRRGYNETNVEHRLKVKNEYGNCFEDQNEMLHVITSKFCRIFRQIRKSIKTWQFLYPRIP